MDPQYHALLLEHAAAQADLDGAIAELRIVGDLVIAELRIPGPPAP